jgi:DNA invertase Pin-like site-specific DNA recombinase
MPQHLEPNVTNRPPGQIVGYFRVSSGDQKTTRQLDGQKLDKRFVDHASGKDTKRPKLESLIDYVREGDTVVVHSMDRLARNLDDLRALVQDFTGRGVHVRFVRESLTFTGEDSPLSLLLLSMLGAVAQFERDLILERQREGIAIAKNRGAYKGRKPSLKPAQMAEVKRRMEAGESPSQIAKDFDVHRQSVYRYAGRLKETRAKRGVLTGSEPRLKDGHAAELVDPRPAEAIA